MTPLDDTSRQQVLERVLNDPWTQTMVQHVHEQGLDVLDHVGWVPPRPPAKRFVGFTVDCVRAMATVLLHRRHDRILFRSMLVGGGGEPGFGSFRLAWQVSRFQDVMSGASVPLVHAGGLGARFGSLDPVAVLLAHVERAHERDWLPHVQARADALVLRLDAWLGQHRDVRPDGESTRRDSDIGELVEA